MFDLHADAVFRYCFLALGSAADADDAVSETFARLIRAPRQRPPAGTTGDPDRAWLFAIARNVVREQRRFRRRHPVLDTDERHVEPLQAPLEDRVAEMEEVSRLRDAMRRVRDDQRQVLLLRFAAGLSSEEAGAVLGKSAGAIRIQQMRALRALRAQLEPTRDPEKSSTDQD